MAEQEKLGDAVLLLSTDEKELLKGINSARAKAGQLQQTFSDTASAINQALATIGVGLSLNAFLQATIAAEHEQVLLAAAVKSTGMASGFTARQLEAQASSLQALTGQSDESIMEAERTLMRFGNVQNDIFKRGLTAALDMAAATGGTAADAARSLGMALQDPAEGLDRLKRAGVNVSASVRAQIVAMEEAGDVLGAQKLLLNEVEKAYGGAAAAARDTMGGALTNLKNVVEDNVLEIHGPFLDALKMVVEALAQGMPYAVRAAAAAFAFFDVFIGGKIRGIMFEFQALNRVIHGDFKGALESMKDGAKAALDSFTKPLAAMSEAWARVGAEQAKMTAETAKAAAEAGTAAGAFDVMGQRGTAAMTAAAESARKASESVAEGARGPLVELGDSYEDLMEKAVFSAQQAQAASALAAMSAKMGLVADAETASRMAATAAANTQRYSQAAIAAMQRTQGAIQGLKLGAAEAAGGLVAAFATGKKSIEEFVSDMIKLIAKLILKMALLQAFGAGSFGASFGGGLIGGLFAEGGEPPVNKPSIVGEEGPELFVPKVAGTIIPNDKLGGGGPSVTVNLGGIQGVDLGSIESAKKLLRTAAAMTRAGVAEAMSLASASADQNTMQPRRAYG